MQAIADGTAAAGAVLLALILTDIGSNTVAMIGLVLLGLALLIRVLVAWRATHTLARQPRSSGARWHRWLHGLYALEIVAFVSGLVLAHSSAGLILATTLTAAIVFIGSNVLSQRAARAHGRYTALIDTMTFSPYLLPNRSA